MEKQRWEESGRRRKEVRRSEKGKTEKKEDAGARKGRKARFTVFFQWFVAPEGRKVTSLKRQVRSHLARWEMNNCTPWWREAYFQVKKCTPLWREAHFQVKTYKAHQRRTALSWDVEKVHAQVARSTFPSQNVQSTPFSDHFWKSRCSKSAHSCGTKHISKSKCTRHTNVGPLLEVEMSFAWHKNNNNNNNSSSSSSSSSSSNLSHRFPILKLPPPPCAVLVVTNDEILNHSLK